MCKMAHHPSLKPLLSVSPGPSQLSCASQQVPPAAIAIWTATKTFCHISLAVEDCLSCLVLSCLVLQGSEEDERVAQKVLLLAKLPIRVTSAFSQVRAVTMQFFVSAPRYAQFRPYKGRACLAWPALSCPQLQSTPTERQSNPAFCSAPRSTSSTLSSGTISSCILSLPYHFTSPASCTYFMSFSSSSISPSFGHLCD